ncbi:zinc ABC transporter substrate-binding protein [Candidatus Poribacteria bacterium]|nr:zinc ABC transporter substrate-binding protein [Candidatus Poribacteria bacterium]
MAQMFNRIAIVTIFIFTLITIGCQTDQSENSTYLNTKHTEKLNVVATISMITDIVENVGGNKINVTGIIGEGVDPHLYKPTARDTQRLKNADIIFYNGLHLEVRITGSVLDKMKDKSKAIAVTDKVHKAQLRPTPEFIGGYDPHVWHDAKIWMNATETVRDKLIEEDPKNAEHYHKNTKEYLKKLQNLHNDLLRLAAQIPLEKRVLITTHDAFGYLGKAYGFEVRGLIGVNTENEVGIADVTDLASFIINRGISTMFVETSAAPHGIKAVQAAVQAKGYNVKIGGSLYADAMGTPGTSEGTYLGMMRYNIGTIANSLQTELELAYSE